MNGFYWFEETLERRKKEVAFNLEAALKKRGTDLKKAFIPICYRWKSHDRAEPIQFKRNDPDCHESPAK